LRSSYASYSATGKLAALFAASSSGISTSTMVTPAWRSFASAASVTACVSGSRSLKKYPRCTPSFTPLSDAVPGTRPSVMIASRRATSATVLAMGPTVSRECAMGVTPAWL
jgi:hypothetical protein